MKVTKVTKEAMTEAVNIVENKIKKAGGTLPIAPQKYKFGKHSPSRELRKVTEKQYKVEVRLFKQYLKQVKIVAKDIAIEIMKRSAVA